MSLEGWIIIGVASAIWIAGWLTTVILALFFNPTLSPEDRKNWRSDLAAVCVLNWFLWLLLLPLYWRRYWFHRDIRTGKRPSWVILDRNECSGGRWFLSDGLECGATVEGGDSDRATRLEAFYLEDNVTGLVEYRVQKVAPVQQECSDWCSMSHDRSDHDDDEEGYVGPETNYEAKVKLPRGKYRAEFRFPNRSGAMEQQSGVTFVVADIEEYADA